jgi:hypothetical protein
MTAWLYRSDADTSGLLLTLYMDGHKLATVSKGQFFGVHVPVGLHAFNWTANGAGQVVVPIGRDTEQAYLEVKFASTQPFPVITPVSVDKAMAVMSDLKPVETTMVFDQGVIVPAQAFAAQPKAEMVKAPPPPPENAPPQHELITPSAANSESAAAPVPSINPAANLARIHKIYVDQLGKGEGSELLREKIRVGLIKSGRFSVVERPEAADAIMTGAAGGVSQGYHSSVSTNVVNGGISGGGSTTYSGHGVLRLVDPKTEESVWIFEYKRGLMSGGSVSSRVAEQVVEKLMKDVMPSKKGKR